jgi:hypothetical protein
MLRSCLIVAGILFLVAAAGAGAASVPIPAVIWLLVLGLIFSLGVLYERSRYKSIADKRPGPDWQATGERFIDPESGKLVEVYFKPATGERMYVKMKSAHPSPCLLSFDLQVLARARISKRQIAPEDKDWLG